MMQLLAELRQRMRRVPKHSAPEFKFGQSPGERLEFCLVDRLRQTGAFGFRVYLRRQEPDHEVKKVYAEGIRHNVPPAEVVHSAAERRSIATMGSV